MMIKLNSRGQFFSQDLIVGLFFFITILIVFFVFSSFIYLTIDSHFSSEKLNHLSFRLNSSLISSPGIPSNWEYNSTDLNNFGLANSKNILSSKKLFEFSKRLDQNYSFYKEKLGVKNLSTGVIDYSSGKFPVNPSIKIIDERIVLINDSNDIFLFRGVIFYE
jgi:hypothetical protein